MRHSVILYILAVLAVMCLNQSTCSNKNFSRIDTVAYPVETAVNKIRIAHPYYNSKVQHKTKAFYTSNNYKIEWLEKKGPSKRFNAFIKEVEESNRYGMDASDYNSKELQEQIKNLYKTRKPSATAIADLDMQITASFFLFTTHLLEGRIKSPGAGEFIWKRGTPEEDDVALLLSMKSASDLRQEIDKLHPNDEQYEKLRKALKQYREVESTSFSQLIIKSPLHAGDSNTVIPEIRKRLELNGFKTSSSDPDSPIYDQELENSVRTFQRTNGIDETGIIDKRTVSLLNIPLTQKADIISLNLERLRWQPRTNIEEDAIIINVPEYMLRVYRNKKLEFDMKVILGSEFNATPIFHDTLKYVVFSPTWNVPKSILENEFLSKLQKDPKHFNSDFTFYKDGEEIDPAEEKWTAKDIDIKKYKVVQKPGNANSLGNVKFVMPNDMNIYLHDTPADQLFDRDERALSHGCVRLEKPLEFAQYLLADQNQWNKEAIESAMASEEPVSVDLKKPYPVYIVYRTAWVDKDGVVNFREDIYGHDERQLAQLHQMENFISVNKGQRQK